MQSGKFSNNYTFFEGYDGEPEIVLMLAEATEYNIHLWEGYFVDIFGEPILDGNGWKGFTRDVHQLEGVFGDNETAKMQEFLGTYTKAGFYLGKKMLE